MNPKKTGFFAIKSAYNLTVKSLKEQPILLVPFAIFACLEFLSIIILFLAPRMPFRLILGPPIRTLWSESYLHYPANFLLLPKLAYLARMGLAIAIGSLLSAMAITLIVNLYHKKHPDLKNSLSSALKNYASFFIITAITVLLFYIGIKVFSKVLLAYFISGHSRLLFIPATVWLGPILFCVNFILAIIIQSAFVYAIPIVIIEKEKLLKALWRALVFFKDNFIRTIILVGLPMLLLVPISVLNYNTVFLIDKFFPEIILWIAVINIIIASLIVDPIVTFVTAVFYLQVKNK